MDLGTVPRWTAGRCSRLRAVGGPTPLIYAEWDVRTNRPTRTLAEYGDRFGDRIALLITRPRAVGQSAPGRAEAWSGVRATAPPVRRGEPTYCLADAAPTLAISDIYPDVIENAPARRDEVVVGGVPNGSWGQATTAFFARARDDTRAGGGGPARLATASRESSSAGTMPPRRPPHGTRPNGQATSTSSSPKASRP